jgi:PAS domain S-box-containing protein
MKSLRLTVYFQILLIIVITNLITGVITYISSVSEVDKQLREQAVQISSQTAHSLTLPFWNLDSIAVDEIIEAQMQNSNMAAIYIQEESEFPQFSMGMEKNQNNKSLHHAMTRPKDLPFSITTPILFEEELLGKVTVVLSNKRMRALIIHNQLLNLFTQLTIMLLLALPLTYVITKSFIRPVENVAMAFSKVVENNFLTSVPPMPQVEMNRIVALFEKVRLTLLKTFATIKENENDLTLTLNSIADGIIAINYQGVISRMNPVAEQITGCSVVNSLGQSFEEFFRSIEGITDEDIKDITENSHPTSIEREITPYGSEKLHTIQITSSRIINERREQSGIVIVLRDRTEQIKIEEELKQSRKMESLGQLSGGVAHDFNNMLGGIIGFTELLQENLAEESEELQYTKYIMDAAHSAADLTTKLLAFSRKGKIVSTPFALHDSCNTAISLLSRTINKNIEITQDLSAPNFHITGDPSQIQNAVLNLCINAKDAMPDGGTIHLATHNEIVNEDNSANLPQGHYIVLTISDTGTGIPKDIIQKIFEPFFTTKETGKGTGLGLAAVYGSIRNHNGTVTVDSVVGKGTTFSIYLPTIEMKKLEQQVNQTKENQVLNKKILVVDDERIIRMMIDRVVADLGGEVFQAEDGLEAVAIFEEKHRDIDLVILDMVMPNLNGDKCFYELKKINPSIPVLLISGFDKNSSISTLIKDGALGYLHKPFQIKELSDILSDLI